MWLWNSLFYDNTPHLSTFANQIRLIHAINAEILNLRANYDDSKTLGCLSKNVRVRLEGFIGNDEVLHFEEFEILALLLRKEPQVL